MQDTMVCGLPNSGTQGIRDGAELNFSSHRKEIKKLSSSSSAAKNDSRSTISAGRVYGSTKTTLQLDPLMTRVRGNKKKANRTKLMAARGPPESKFGELLQPLVHP